MASQSADNENNQSKTQDLLLRADEVDTGTTIQSPKGVQPLSALSGTSRPIPPPRPALRRETSAPPPPPPSQPPPAPPPDVSNQSGDPTDSLNLPQLKHLLGHAFSIKPEAKAYAYEYEDAQDFSVEIDEWFHYTKPNQDRDYLLAAREAFEEAWQNYSASVLKQKDAIWTDVDHEQRTDFLTRLIPQLGSAEITTRQRAVATILYVLSGIWTTSAGVESTNNEQPHDGSIGNPLQIEWMHKNADLILKVRLLQPLYDCMRNALERPLVETQTKTQGEEVYEGAFDDPQYCEVSLCFSCFYIVIESARSRLASEPGRKLRLAMLSLQPNFLVFMTRTISRLRWDESYNIPLMHAVQLLWKSILLVFGDTKDYLQRVKGILQPRDDPFSTDVCKPILTASPLDYHLFRQEITSKYPAYNPPLPLIPLETDQRNILPPLPHHAARADGFDAFHKTNQSSGSIMHQPVHIATPAPSPPPSPGGPGGKGGKKQNYQTNQYFPFLYPPLDDASNNIGGSGTTEFQDSMVGRKWEGSDVPASILEAGELFASRMRMTRAMRQLWKERDQFMKYDRGWNKGQTTTDTKLKQDEDAEADKLQDPELQARMDAVESYFHRALPDLQSLIIVMMKIMLTNVQDIAVRNSQLQEAQSGIARNKSATNLPAANQVPSPPSPPRPNEISLDDLDNIRTREISQKAISASLFLMLKWFKISHILKFEYITQLLLDSNYIQLTLKYFAHQHLEELVAFRYDRDDLSFWRYCQIHSDHPPLSPTSPTSLTHNSDPEDDAIPPAIQRHRRSPTAVSDSVQQPQQPSSPTITMATTLTQQLVTSPPPLADELGNPIGDNFPSTPLPTSAFSTRNFHTAISLLRILQKLTRGKSHRILLLVSFKSAQILRRILRVPEPTLSLYILKLFKSQVPYCGRKWRQSNMRVITAIYLHCRPELRDEWLAGMHDAAPGAGMSATVQDSSEFEEAVPLEWGLRGLTFWWMKRNYGDVMKVKEERNRKPGAYTDDDDDVTSKDEEGGQEVDDEERDFFKRELDAVGWGIAGLSVAAEDEDVAFGEEAPGASGEMANGVAGNASANVNGAHRQQTAQNQDFRAQQQQWAAESPNSDFGPQGAGGVMAMGGVNLAAWQ